MKIYKKLFLFGLVLATTFGLANNAFAVMPTLSLSSLNNNNINVTVYGDANSSINLYYNSNSGLQNVYLGNTNNVGYFSTLLTSSNYNIAQGGSVYIIVNNQQSNSTIWPNTYSQNNNVITSNNNSNFNISNLSLPVLGSATITLTNGATGVYVSSNSNPSVVNAILISSNINTGCGQYDQYNTLTGQSCFGINNNNYYNNYNNNYNTSYNSNGGVTLTALSAGSSTITICQNSVYNNYSNTTNNCNTMNVNVVNNNNIINSGSVLGASTTGSNCYLSRTLKYGMYGSDVSCLQTYLRNKGYLHNSNTNSYFDVNTRNAVVLFQRDRSLFSDGVVGRNTRNVLY